MIIPNNGFNDAFLYFRVKEWTIIVNDLVASLHIEAQLNKATVNNFLLLPLSVFRPSTWTKWTVDIMAKNEAILLVTVYSSHLSILSCPPSTFYVH